MGLVKMECPGCGQSIQLDNSREFGFCTYCGTKVMVDRIIVQHQGTVVIDQSREIKNLYELARRAKNDNNSVNAQKYYEQILIKDPSSWEANFYTIYYQSMNCRVADIRSAAINLTNCEFTALQLIRDNVTNPEEQRLAVGDMAARLMQISKMFCNATMSHYGYANNQAIPIEQYFSDLRDKYLAAINICYFFGDYVISVFGNNFGSYASLPCWASAVDLHKNLLAYAVQKKVERKALEPHKNQILAYVSKIQRFDPSYPTPKIATTNIQGFIQRFE